jgi:hypothetical protein
LKPLEKTRSLIMVGFVQLWVPPVGELGLLSLMSLTLTKETYSD